MLHPLAILLIGIIIVVGMIIVLRVNAFLALVTAAMVVSLLSAGALSDKIARVAAGFGRVAGNIGIVIGMASIIGKCLMDSGAADRIVRSFLKLLGEKRAAWALMASSFVLAMPVFFDTVFYLLVPLARSLWRRTRKNYLLYVLAIGAGGAVTHTLVPPTPGPLLIADALHVDLGVMIMVGTLIGLPTAVVGMLLARLANRWTQIPMRPYAGEPEQEPLLDSQLPALWVAVLPVVLPVILISTNTAAKMLADAEHGRLLRQGEVLDWAAFSARLSTATQPAAAPPLVRVWELLPADLQQALSEQAGDGGSQAGLEAQVEAAIRRLVETAQLSREPAFAAITLSDKARRLRDRGLERLSPGEAEDLNWMVLESAFPEQVKKTPRRQAAGVAALLGDANLALLLSAVIAMATLARQRRLTLGQLAQATESALMSAGVIILITAGGGAFGLMLQEAGIKDYIEATIGKGDSGLGLLLLGVGFGVAAVMKIAQGSSTVAMITTAGMMAAMGVSSEMLGCHLVYLATSIACGSLVCSWMNDSGFWIVARMSVLSEAEALKSWTVVIALVGITGFCVTLLFAFLMPLA